MAGISNDGGSTYPKEYLDGIQKYRLNSMDAKENGGDGDGQASVQEALADLQIDSLFNGLKQGSQEYNRLKNLTDALPQALAKYAGADGIFTAEEYANFLNGAEWGAVLDAHHSSSNFAKMEMGWIDDSPGMSKDGQVTKDEVKAGILNNLIQRGINVDTAKIEELIDKYAGEDGTFTVEEYTALKNDEEYKSFLKQYHAVPFNIKG